MSRKPAFNQELLEKLLADGNYTQLEMARMLNISDSFLGDHLQRRRKAEERKQQMIAASRVTIKEQAGSIWNLTTLIDEVCAKVRPMLASAEEPKDVSMLSAVLIKAQDYTLKLVEKQIAIEQTKAFDAGILKALGDASPELREKAIANIKAFKAEAGLLFQGELNS